MNNQICYFRRKLILAFIFSVFFSFQSDAQFGDPEFEVENLSYIAKTWGYLKYFHPTVRNCSEEWDAVLFSTLDDLNGAPQSSYHEILENMIDFLGPLPSTTQSPPTIINDEELNNLNLDWMDSDHLSSSLQDKLKMIYQRSKPGSHCLYSEVFTGGNLEFDSEILYADQGAYPDLNYRVLAFFRFWNTIEYFFPYKHLMDKDWDDILAEFIMPVIEAENELEYHLEFMKLRSSLNDTHGFIGSYVWAVERGVEVAPYKLKYVEDKTVVIAIADIETELEVGDILLEIEGVSVEELRDQCRPFMAASNEVVMNRNINSGCLIWGDFGVFDIKVEKADGSEMLINDLHRSTDDFRDFQWGLDTKPSWEKIELAECGEIGYVDMELLTPDEISAMVSDLWDLPAIVFDLRNYPQGTLWHIIPEMFNGPVHVANFTGPNKDYAGQFQWSEARLGYWGNANPYDGKVIILFNEETQSQAEYTVMGLERHENSIKIGSTTAAADGNVSNIGLPGEITMYFTGLGTYYPDGTQTQRVGILPDIEVLQTIDGIRAEEDEVLNVALDCNLINPNSSVTNNQTTNEFKIYPNPISNQLQIGSSDILDIDLEIYNLEGTTVFSKKTKTNVTIDISNLNQGFYVLCWKTKDRAYSEKVVKID